MSYIKSDYNFNDHFSKVGKIVQLGSKVMGKFEDYKLLIWACYLYRIK